jgi:hypothetical protein
VAGCLNTVMNHWASACDSANEPGLLLRVFGVNVQVKLLYFITF